ncbi:MAG: vitamin B12-dependent ribonucleotide reductase [bacterium]
MFLTKNAKEVLERRYLRKDERREVVETPEEMFRRVAENIASAELLYDKNYKVEELSEIFYKLMTEFEFLPNSPALMNAGRDLQQLAACFVLPVEDSMEDIFEAVKNSALIHKSGGGTGFDFSHLRPKNDIVSTTHGLSSGPVSFMRVFDMATQAVQQGGFRRGANMGILRVDHPDIVEFITCKQREGEFPNFNISVAVTDEFMEAVRNDDEYPLINPRTNQAVKRLKAREVFNLIVDSAWKNGEPGIVFIDTINKHNTLPKLGRIEATNPCGEMPLLPYEACVLGSVNLSRMVKLNEIDWDRLRRVVETSTHFLDNAIDVSKFPLQKITEEVLANRKIGLGVMGFADMLIKLGIPYDSDEAVALAEKIMKFITDAAMDKSEAIAKVKGSFSNFEKSVFYGQRRALRNATVTTIAPTGTISIIAGTSSGIEPLFAVSYVKTVMDGTELIEVNELFEEMAKKGGFYSKELMRRIAREGTLRDIKEVPEDVKRLFVTAHDIPPERHIAIQAAFQKYTHNAVSKTINFPNQATRDDVRRAYIQAWESGCKGITVYRDGSRESQVLTVGAEGAKEKKKDDEYLRPQARPVTLSGFTIRFRTGCGNLYVTINERDGKPFEIFAQMGKSGGCIASQTESVARLASLALRSNIHVEEIIKELKGIRCPTPMMQPGGTILSCSDAVAKAMEMYVERRVFPSDGNGACPECPDCGSILVFEEGCMKCHNCGYSKCD